MIYIAAYKGTSLISKLIKIITRSDYSHVSIVFSSGIEYEAWHISDQTRWYKPFAGCFQEILFGQNHTKGTVVDLFKIPNIEKVQVSHILKVCRQFAKDKIPYDYMGCTRFLTKINRGDDKKLFCSESIMTLFNRAAYKLLVRCEAWQISPAELIHSKELIFLKTIEIGGGECRKNGMFNLND